MVTRRADGSVIRNCEDVDPAVFEDPARVTEAKGLCFTCPARAECLRDALARPTAGVAGGLTEAERQALLDQTGGHTTEPSPLVWADDRQIVADHMSIGRGRMSPLIAEVIRARVVAGQDDKEISAAIGLSREGVGRYRKRFTIAAAKPPGERLLAMVSAPHGSSAAYKQHRKNREPTCDECRAGHAARERDRLARSRQRLAGMPTVRRAS